MTSGRPACTISTSVPTDTFFDATVTWISPGRLGSSNFSCSGAICPERVRYIHPQTRTLACGEVPKGHFERAADFRFQMMHSDARPVNDALSLDREGFVLVHHQTAA